MARTTPIAAPPTTHCIGVAVAQAIAALWLVVCVAAVAFVPVADAAAVVTPVLVPVAVAVADDTDGVFLVVADAATAVAAPSWVSVAMTVARW
jgi:hypothetical protein